MSVIVKRQKKRDRGYNFKIMNRDADDPLFHDPSVPNKILVHAPTRSEMKQMRKQKDRDLPEYLKEVNNTYNTEDLEGYDEDKDIVDYAFDEFNRKLEEGEGEGDEDDYEFDEVQVDAEGDEDYEFLGFNNKVDLEFAEEVKQNFKYKPADGVKFVEYDAYGLPKTEEIMKMKREMNMKDEDVFRDDGTQVLFIKPPEEYKLYGYHRNVDIERKNMNEDMREVYDMMQDRDNEVPEDEIIDDDFLKMLNDNQPALIEKDENDYEEIKEFEYEDMGEGDMEDMEAMAKARAEADAMFKNMPMGLSEDMQLALAGAREHLANKKAAKEQVFTQEEIDHNFEDILDEYQDDDLGAINDNLMGPMEDMIDQEAFDEIMQEFIETNKDYCKKLYTKYHDDEFSTKIKVEGEAVEEIVESIEDGETDKIYKILRQKNGDLVKLVPKEEMERIQEKMNAEEIAKTKAAIKNKILKFNEECLRQEAEGDLEEVSEEEEEDQEQKWDVESILSTRTNTDNHPGVIKGVVKAKKNKIILDPKTKAPELELESPEPAAEKPKRGDRYIEEIVSDEDSEEEVDVNTTELKDLETMTEAERKKYLRKMNKKQVKKEKKERRVEKKNMKKEFSRQHQRYTKMNTVGKGEIRPGVSVRKL